MRKGIGRKEEGERGKGEGIRRRSLGQHDLEERGRRRKPKYIT